jgi:hypothetical protein
MFGKTKWILTGLLVIALLTLGVGSSIALAQGPTPPAGGKNWMQLYWDALAKRLGVSVDKLQQTMKDARTDALDQAVKQGLLTQAQADKRKQQSPADRWAGLKDRRQAFVSFGKNTMDAVAKVLGMSTDDLLKALRGGKTLADLAKEKNVDQAKIKQIIIDAGKAAVDQAVKDSKLTKERADALKAKLDPSKIDLTKKHFSFPGRGPLKK